MECLRRLLRRSSEALYLLQLVSQHNITRLVQQLDPASRQKLGQLTFHQLVCSDEGDRTASKLISNLMEVWNKIIELLLGCLHVPTEHTK